MYLKRLIILFTLFFLLSASICYAEDIVVEDVDQVFEAMEDADENDTIVFKPGTYNLNIELVDKDLKFRGEDTANTFLISEDDEKPVFSVNEISNVTIQNFTFNDGLNAVQIFESNNARNIKIFNNIFNLEGDSIAIDIIASPSTSIDIENNTFYNNFFDVNLGDDENSGNIIFQHNIVHNTRNSENSLKNLPLGDVSYNCFNEDISGVTGTNNNINKLASYVAAPDDLHLRVDSPCIDNGETEDDFDETFVDLGAYGGPEDDLTPYHVEVDEVKVSSATDIADSSDTSYTVEVSWLENLDYRISGYKVYYTLNGETLKNKNYDDDRINFHNELEAKDATKSVFDILVSEAEKPAAPKLDRLEPRDETLLIYWTKSENAISYTINYSGTNTAADSVDVDDVDNYELTGLSNDETYTVSVTANNQSEIKVQVAAYIEFTNEDDETEVHESSFINDDVNKKLGEIIASDVSNTLTMQPERIIAYPPLPNEGCFIATAAFGYYSAAEVQVLRDFRDDYLLKSAAGMAFVKWYYTYGPYAAAYIQENSILKPLVRTVLYPLIFSVQILYFNMYLFFTFLMVIIGFTVGLTYLIMRRSSRVRVI